MFFNRNLGLLLLAIWLILEGLLSLLGASNPAINLIMAILALAAGILILLGPTNWSARGRRSIEVTRSPGMLLLAIWLILTGLLALLTISLPGIGLILAVIALAAGILILIGR
jgi:hypothetical protein